MSSELLKSLGLDAINAGTYLGNGEWSSATSGELITPVNPTTGEPIAQVRATTEAE
jgi:aldehyde dehydrogenase (NAD+)